MTKKSRSIRNAAARHPFGRRLYGTRKVQVRMISRDRVTSQNLIAEVDIYIRFTI